MRVEMYTLDAIYDLAETGLGNNVTEFLSNALFDFFDLDLTAEKWIKTYWAELYPYIDENTENPIKYPQAFRNETMYNIGYTFLSVLPADVFHDIPRLKSLLVEAKRRIADGLPIDSIVKYLTKNA